MPLFFTLILCIKFIMFSKNINALKIKNLKLARQLEEISLDEAQSHIGVHKSDSGDLIISYDDVLLEDSQNPLEFAKKILQSRNLSDFSNNDFIVIYGLGLGYLFKRCYVSTLAKNLIYEPNLFVWRFVLEYVDFSDQILDPKVFLFAQESELIDFLLNHYLINDKIDVLYYPLYASFKKEELSLFVGKILDSCEAKRADISTTKKLSKCWVENTLINSLSFDKMRSLTFFKGIFEDKIALILAAGPSLRSNIELIKNNRDKFVIFAANKALLFLVKNSIFPDFLLAADAKYVANTVNVSDEILNKISLISTTKTDPCLMHMPFASKIAYFLENDSLYSDLIDLYPNEIKPMPTAGTAVSLGYYSALEMGFKNILFVGFDLAIKEDQLYGVDLDAALKEDMVFSCGENKQLTKVKSITGELIKTRKDYSVFIKQFEYILASKPEGVSVYNASDFGAFIEGMEYISFTEFLEFCDNSYVRDVSEKIVLLFADTKVRWLEIYLEKNKLFESYNLSMLSLKSIIENLFNNKAQNFDEKPLLNILNEILKNQILFSFFQTEILEYLDLRNKDSDLSNSYLIELFQKVCSVVPKLLAITRNKT